MMKSLTKRHFSIQDTQSQIHSYSLASWSLVLPELGHLVVFNRCLSSWFMGTGDRRIRPKSHLDNHWDDHSTVPRNLQLTYWSSVEQEPHCANYSQCANTRKLSYFVSLAERFAHILDNLQVPNKFACRWESPNKKQRPFTFAQNAIGLITVLG